MINLKAYAQVGAAEIDDIADTVVRVEAETGVRIAVCPPAVWIARASSRGARVLAQHADPVEPGAKTGFLPAELLKHAGASGLLLNHSEHRLQLSDIEFLVRRAEKLGLMSVVCADTPPAALAAAALSPDIVAVEPPELIGTGISVSKAKPEVITDTVSRIEGLFPKVAVIAGAGIVDAADVRRAVELGADGALVASAVALAPSRSKVIEEMARAML
ncbi:MAG: triose-phosphate isomerase [Methanomassiliicoccales archaeon]